MLKGHRPYRATRRWPCVLFDLIALTSQASYVLYYTKFPGSSIARKKNRREFLYQLGIELVIPEILRRRNSNSLDIYQKKFAIILIVC